ncbi:peptide/nickel transport system permease protein [Pseudarthrobacter oxydans]|uniref:Peptide/nickel transport system permease protein n=1 Tax=Pseudarthrobacter oxydans TaxID=1671 RepID=A0AAW8NB49_PSEOX|nr:ABC transporter permease [Pseudarthrobacter oxydans]MDR6792009.1 peptide/nickel transport system permease protein [Pseudarthrobacter oxydans]MDR7163427.1 peptide/nickel transport system permease protein [Pseudarthrobacter oxydans]
MTTAILQQPGTTADKTPAARKPNRSFVHGILTNKKALAGMAVMLVFIALALLAPVLFPGDPSRITAMASLEPSAEHWLGTTAKGQDVLALTVHGSRSSLFVGLTVGFASTFVGILVGLASAYFGKFIDEALSLATNVFLLLPGLPLLVILAAFLPPGLGTVILVLVVTGWAGSARVLRSQALSIRSKDFVAAAVVSGERAGRIMFREILPNMASIVMGTLLACVIYGIGAQAGLEFLGLGDAGTVSWGNNLFWAGNEGALLTGSWWVFVPSGVCIALVAFALALINYAVDEVTNPRLRKIKTPKDTERSASK